MRPCTDCGKHFDQYNTNHNRCQPCMQTYNNRLQERRKHVTAEQDAEAKRQHYAARNAEIVRLAKLGMSHSEIGKQFGLTKGAIGPVIRNAARFADCASEAVRLANKGLSQRQIGLNLRLPKAQVRRILERAGIKTDHHDPKQHGHRRSGIVNPGRPRNEDREPVPITLPRVRCLEESE